jgi:hypothetical protein
MKNKNNIFARIWHAIKNADYLENHAEINAHAIVETTEPSRYGARDDSDNPMQMYSPADDAHTAGLGNAPYNWRLTDDWPIAIIDGDNKPKIALKMDARAFMFHVSTWAIVTGRRQRNLCVSIRGIRDLHFNVVNNGFLLLPEGEEYDSFQLWWKAYVERFRLEYLHDPITDNNVNELPHIAIFPEMPDSYVLDGTAFNHEGMDYIPKIECWLPSNRLFKQWCWIVENCKGHVWVTQNQFIFEDNSDAVLFKLITPEDKLR